MPYWDIDAGMACMLMLLKAVDEGLGGWFFGFNQGEPQLLEGLGVGRITSSSPSTID
jgi:hypothetical protein